MTDEQTEPLYFEPGASWWGLLFGPVFAALGVAFEAFTVGPIFWGLWLIAGAILTVFAALWVYARRRFAVVRVTHEELTQGSEQLALKKIKTVSDSTDQPRGARVLGGGQGVPRKYDSVLLKLTDGSLALAWARDGDGLREALRAAAQDVRR